MKEIIYKIKNNLVTNKQIEKINKFLKNSIN